jgi:hypothetical protein
MQVSPEREGPRITNLEIARICEPEQPDREPLDKSNDARPCAFEAQRAGKRNNAGSRKTAPQRGRDSNSLVVAGLVLSTRRKPWWSIRPAGAFVLRGKLECASCD